MTKQLFVFVFITCLSVLHLPAQESKAIVFDNFTTKDGLPDNYCEAILQDSYGFVWIGTQDGLCRYDGFNYRVYRNMANDITSVSSNFMYSLFEDSRGNLWIGTRMGGLMRYNREMDNFERFIFDADTLKHARNWIVQMTETENYLWIGTFYGLGRFDYRTKETKWYVPADYNGLKVHHILSVLGDKNDKVWAGSLEGGLYYFNNATEQFEKQYVHNNNIATSISDNKIKYLYKTRDGKFWVATEEGGLNLFDENKATFKHFRHQPGDANSISTDDIRCLLEDSEGNFWVGTINGGLCLFDRKSGTFQSFNANENDPVSVNSRSIIGIVEGFDGNIWLGTHGGGLNVINPRKHRFEHIKLSNLLKQDINNEYISFFYEGKDSTIWVGTDGAGLFEINRKENKFFAYGKKNGFNSMALLDVEDAGDNKIWIATWEGGLNLFDTQTKQVVKRFVSGGKGSISINDLKGIFKDGDKLWVATHGDGINVLDLANDKFTNWKNNTTYQFNMKEPEWGNVVLKDSKKRIWFGTLEGLHLYDNNRFKSFLKKDNDTTSLNGSIISCIFEDSKGRIWIGTDGGLNLFNEKTVTFTRLDPNYGLPLKIKSIEEDDNGVFWISSNTGLYKFDFIKKSTSHFDYEDGLQGNQFFEKSSLKLSTGEFLFGGLNGFNIFHPDSIIPNNIPPRVYIIDFKIFDKSQKAGTADATLKKDIAFTKEITIDHTQSVISFEYVGVSFIAQQKNQYAVLLEGFEEKWRNVGAERKATFTNLKPGEYIFKVKASNNEGIWGEEASIIITVLPPWWKTLLFRVLVIILILSLIIGFYQFRLSGITKANRNLEEEVKKRTDDLLQANTSLKEHQHEIITKNEELGERNEELFVLNQTKDKFFSIIAHDLKNPINTILGFSNLLIVRKEHLGQEKTDKYIELIHQSSQSVSDLLTNLLEWAHSQLGGIVYSPKPHYLGQIVEQNVDLHSSMVNKKDVEVIVENTTKKQAKCDGNMINTVIRNLLHNAIKYTPRKGKITVKVEETGDIFKVSVCDTGVGIPKEKLQELLEPNTHFSTKGTENEHGSGLGLALCKDFIDKHNGALTIESTLGKGSIFSFTLPKS